ncbi:thioredoxin-like 3-2, chloroplastic [Momordica charantia]|uniref:Thioredoxin-like 3-2, chloroplastic n=1 Tax=Momordica charantia TaxID=3673 RepID=A0A6J1CBF6_MOMCH|nr:thioredoxin-like 3-2, chloroplastic [Momordica charantia]XP_022138918.1 thioredoxin-like 3-2, chloroplastic [Momordica charantia]XP_022138919.1 thioredoxin-like 3-2, chloroplastic [Momordica charantia]
MVKALPLHLGTAKSFAKFHAPFDLSTPPHLPAGRLAGSGFNRLPLPTRFPPLSQKVSATGEKTSLLGAWTQESPLQFRDESPVSIELKSISSEHEFDQAILDAAERDELVILVWMADWCRNYIYLKPQLERLAADYYPRLQFYCIDVNTVPHKLVVRAGLAKMPAIQLWKDGKKQDEVIGLYKAYLVANDVQKMIECELTGE